MLQLASRGPSAIAIDADNNLYITDTGNNRVVLWTPEPGKVAQGCAWGVPCVFRPRGGYHPIGVTVFTSYPAEFAGAGTSCATGTVRAGRK